MASTTNNEPDKVLLEVAIGKYTVTAMMIFCRMNGIGWLFSSFESAKSISAFVRSGLSVSRLLAMPTPNVMRHGPFVYCAQSVACNFIRCNKSIRKLSQTLGTGPPGKHRAISAWPKRIAFWWKYVWAVGPILRQRNTRWQRLGIQIIVPFPRVGNNRI